MSSSYLLVVKLLFIITYLRYSDGHGRLVNPPARSSAWRYDSRFPPYYDDMQMFCGGRPVQWNQNGGKCSICGEDYALTPKLFEKGGSMYTGIIVKEYTQGQTIDVYVQITANHMGWFEFRICNVDGSSSEATQDCLDKRILTDTSGKSRFSIASTVFDFRVQLVLPADLACDHCVFQWKYNTGNNWGTDPITGQGCLGCGPGQEQFYGCSDIAIHGSSPNTKITTILPKTTIPVSITTKPSKKTKSKVASTTPNPTTTVALSGKCTNGDGLYASTENGCKGFYICAYTGTQFAQVIYQECPFSLLFDNVLKGCNWPSQVKC